MVHISFTLFAMSCTAKTFPLLHNRERPLHSELSYVCSWQIFRHSCKVHCIEISEKENEDNARVTEAENMGHLIQIHPESFCETSLPDNSVDAV